MIRNLHTDPHCYKTRKVWNSQALANGDKWRYELAAGQAVGGVFCWSPLDTSDLAGHVLFARLLSGVQAVFDNLHIEYGTTIAKRGSWIAATIANNVSGSIMIRTVNGPFVLENVGIYTPSDWDKIHDLYTAGILPYPWIEGEYLPLGGGGTPLAVSMPIHILIARCAHEHAKPATRSQTNLAIAMALVCIQKPHCAAVERQSIACDEQRGHSRQLHLHADDSASGNIPFWCGGIRRAVRVRTEPTEGGRHPEGRIGTSHMDRKQGALCHTGKHGRHRVDSGIPCHGGATQKQRRLGQAFIRHDRGRLPVDGYREFPMVRREPHRSQVTISPWEVAA